MEPQKQGNSAGPGPEVVQRVTKERACKECVAGHCRMRLEVSSDECPQALQEALSILPILER